MPAATHHHYRGAGRRLGHHDPRGRAEAVPGFAVDNWYGFFAPRATPRPIVARLHGEINRSLELPDVKERLQGLGIFSFLTPTPEAFGDYVKAEIAKYAKVVQDSGVRID